MSHGTIIATKYWGANGIGIAVVAVEGGANDVGAYIGATTDEKMEDTFRWTVSHGAKLYREEAEAMLPSLRERMEATGLSYRN